MAWKPPSDLTKGSSLGDLEEVFQILSQKQTPDHINPPTSARLTVRLRQARAIVRPFQRKQRTTRTDVTQITVLTEKRMSSAGGRRQLVRPGRRASAPAIGNGTPRTQSAPTHRRGRRLIVGHGHRFPPLTLGAPALHPHPLATPSPLRPRLQPQPPARRPPGFPHHATSYLFNMARTTQSRRPQLTDMPNERDVISQTGPCCKAEEYRGCRDKG